MIRAIARFILHRELGALRARVHELEIDNRELAADVRDQKMKQQHLLNEQYALQKRALRPDPTPAEAELLNVVRANPGATAPEIAMVWFRIRADRARARHMAEKGADYPHAWWNSKPEPGCSGLADEAKPLTTLFKKSLVRREKAGNTYRYWVNE